MRLDRQDRNRVQSPVVRHPPEKRSPTGIGDRFGKVPVPDQVAYLQVFEGNQIARCDERVRRLAGEIFTLPLDFQIFPG